tara:strand:+ start:1028 stop:2737 length:1710 start_codon:yes stop_codon:yes gene_type:complete
MFFSNGLKNINITLVVSIIFFVSISTLINFNLKKTKAAQISFPCSDHYMFGQEKIKNSHIYLKFCNEFKESIDKKYENLNGVSQNYKFTFFEPDNYSYLNNLAKLNEINFAKKKILTLLKKNGVDTISLLNNISFSISKADFISTDYTSFDKEIKKLKTLEFLRKHHIDNIDFLNIFSNIYTSIFDKHDKLSFFIILINILTLVVLSLFIFYFFKQFIVNNIKLTLFLVLFTIFNPFNIIYFFSFSKEVFILVFFLGLIVNLIYIDNNSKNKYINLLFSFFFLLTLFIFILQIKNIYFLPSILGLIICYVTILYKKKSLLFGFIHAVKIILLILILFKINTYYKLSPTNISNHRATEFVANLMPMNNENTTQYFRLDDNFIKKNKIDDEKYENQLMISRKFQNYDCKTEILKFLCKKINSFSFKLSSIKKATMEEAKYSSNKNIIVGYKLNGVNDVLQSSLFALIKSQFMPFSINSFSMITLISFYKVILIIFSIFCIYRLIRSKKKFIIYLSILIFLPFLTAIDLITSNFFTYFRYVAPYNLILSMIAILGFLYLFKENDKYLYKLWS